MHVRSLSLFSVAILALLTLFTSARSQDGGVGASSLRISATEYDSATSNPARKFLIFPRHGLGYDHDSMYVKLKGSTLKADVYGLYVDTSIVATQYDLTLIGGGTDTTSLSNRIDLRQLYSDTGTTDATRYWTISQGYVSSIDSATKFLTIGDAVAAYQPKDADLTTYAGLPPTTSMQNMLLTSSRLSYDYTNKVLSVRDTTGGYETPFEVIAPGPDSGNVSFTGWYPTMWFNQYTTGTNTYKRRNTGFTGGISLNPTNGYMSFYLSTASGAANSTPSFITPFQLWPDGSTVFNYSAVAYGSVQFAAGYGLRNYLTDDGARYSLSAWNPDDETDTELMSVYNGTFGVEAPSIDFTDGFRITGVRLAPTITELNYVDGVTSAIQTQLNAKAPLVSPSFTTPTLGVATATSINKLTITAPATSATLTIVNGGSLITAGAYATTLTSTGTTNVTLPTTGTLSTLAGSEAVTNKTFGMFNYAADAQASDTYVITLSPAPAAYTTGMVIYFKANTANTGAASINVNSLGAKTIVKAVSTTLANNDILASMFCALVYDGTNMVLMNPRAL